eukprot:TRINITY_DN2226_c0_g1_i6.p1 TRINITY_DN2226_c0_g1~~TRINITY_DN2226_c0_g1_i6.p1  ORF type:complete len:312 (+),score=32.76 TRINITY_DN2226_c0_g1_i6:79-936(+)
MQPSLAQGLTTGSRTEPTLGPNHSERATWGSADDASRNVPSASLAPDDDTMFDEHRPGLPDDDGMFIGPHAHPASPDDDRMFMGYRPGCPDDDRMIIGPHAHPASPDDESMFIGYRPDPQQELLDHLRQENGDLSHDLLAENQRLQGEAQCTACLECEARLELAVSAVKAGWRREARAATELQELRQKVDRLCIELSGRAPQQPSWRPQGPPPPPPSSSGLGGRRRQGRAGRGTGGGGAAGARPPTTGSPSSAAVAASREPMRLQALLEYKRQTDQLKAPSSPSL